MTINILLADDHHITREGLASLIENQEGMAVAGQADNGRKAVELALSLIPDLVIMDINMPELNGIEATRQILSRQPQIRILVLSMYTERRYVTGMLEAGALGYVLKNCMFSELIDAVKTLMQGRRYLSQSISDMLMDDFIQGRKFREGSETTSLTSREREILQMIAEGFSSIQIAGRLHISERTVSTHRRKIMDKLNVHNIAGLTKVAIREGMVSLET